MNTPIERVELSRRCTLGVGGSARVARVRSTAELVALLSELGPEDRPIRVLGGGSNLVIADAPLGGLVLDLGLEQLAVTQRGDRVRLDVGAGRDWDALVELCCHQGWTGLECLSGIPGRVGATPIQNVGAYGQEVSQTLVELEALELETRELRIFSTQECKFAYRDSYFKSEAPGRFVVTRVSFELEAGGRPELRYAELERAAAERGVHDLGPAELRELVLGLRRGKSMVYDPADPNHRSCGSFFTNPIVSPEVAADVQARAGGQALPSWPQPDGRVKLAAAWLIQTAGLERGLRDGAVGLSTAHTLQLVCHEGASAADVVRFAIRIRATVEQRFGVRLVPEPVFWGFGELEDGLPRI